MSRHVLFNGQLLRRPGAYSVVDASAFTVPTFEGVGIIGLIGEADGGAPGLGSFGSASAVRNAYRKGALVEAADAASKGSNDTIITGQPSLYVTYKVNNSTQSGLTVSPHSWLSKDYGLHTNNITARVTAPNGGSERMATFSYLDVNGYLKSQSTPIVGSVGKLSLQYLGAAGGCGVTVNATNLTTTTFAAAGFVLSAPGPFNLADSDVLTVKVDGGGSQPFTFAAGRGSVSSANGPFNVTPGSDLQIAVNGGAAQVFVFNAAAGFVQGLLGTFAGLNGTTLVLKVNGGAPVTVNFTVAEVDATTTAAKIAADVGASVTTSVLAGQVRITSATKGTGSSIEITGVNAAAGFPNTLLQNGTGDAVNIAAMTNTEVITKLATLTGATAVPSGAAFTLRTTGFGTSFNIQVLALSTADTAMSLDNLVHNGSGDAANIAATTAAEVVTKLSTITGAVASVSGSSFKITSSLVGAGSSIQISPTSTTLVKFGLDTFVHLGGAAVSADNLNLAFTDYPDLSSLIRAINVTGKYSATALTTNSSWDTTYFDAATITDCRISAIALYARNWDLFDAVNTTVDVVTATLVKGQAGPVATFGETAFVGGTAGVSNNLAWANGFKALGSVIVNQLVVCASTNGTNGSTYTMDSIVSGALSHANYFNSTAGKAERQIWLGLAGTKTELKNWAQLVLNSAHVVLFGQKYTRPSAVDAVVRVFPEYITAAVAAGMRAGAPTGEPLTFKYVNTLGLSSDSSWSANDPDDITEMSDAGVMVIVYELQKGYRFERGITTYTRDDNAAFYAEEVVQNWKQYSYELRKYLQEQLVGRPNTATRVANAKTYVIDYSERALAGGLIVDSLNNGTLVKGYRNIKTGSSGNVVTADLTISPGQGIDFVLSTIALVPASNSSN